MAVEDQPQTGARPRVRLSFALLVVYLVLVAWAFYDGATDWPHVGSWSYLVFILLCPGIVYQSFSLAYTRRTGRAVTRPVLTRLATIPLGLVFAGLLMSWSDTISMRAFARVYAPFVAQVGASLPDPCRAAGRHFQLPAVAAYNLRTGRDRPVAKLHHDDARFVLAFRGGSADIDGSTFYYDSGVSAWFKFHNDNGDARAAYDKATAGLAECLVQGAGPAP
jgi:hypothetical protein